MQPLITFRRLDHSSALETDIRKRIAKLAMREALDVARQ